MSKKKLAREKKTSIEDIYRNKHFVPPKEQNLETIFEEPRQSKDGEIILTSVKKYKRYLHFDPTQNKIQKRKRKAKKCFKKLKSNYRITRSSPDNSKCDDISLYILDLLGHSSNDSNMGVSNNTDQNITFSAVDVDQTPNFESSSTSSARNMLCSGLCDTPKRTLKGSRSLKLQKLDNESEESTDVLNDNSKEVTVTIACDVAEKSNIKSDDVEETLESPRRSCCIS